MKKINPDIARLLDEEAERINSRSFIDSDPVQFPRQFSDKRDIEIVAFLSAIMAWGNRKMICKDIDKTLTLMDRQPFSFLMDKGYEAMNPELNIHRTLFAGHLAHFMRGLRYIYKNYGTLDCFAQSKKIADSPLPAWNLVEEIQNVMIEENNGVTCSRCLPLNLQTTALKRVNMALRWLVRDDGIVDMGIWECVDKSKLYIPLDVHVGNVSRELGLLDRKANDKKSVILLTELLRTIRPEDPCIYDYALFGIGANV